LFLAYQAERFRFVDEIHIERMAGRPHFYVHWSIGVIGTALDAFAPVKSDIPVKSWQKAVDWNGKRKPLKPYAAKVHSEDELSAIGMGIYWHGRN